MPRAKARALPASLGFKAGPAKLIDPNRPPQPTNPIFNPEGCKQYIIYTVSRPDQPGMQVGIQPCSLSLPCTSNRFGFDGENVKHLPHLVPCLSHFTLSLEIYPMLSSDMRCACQQCKEAINGCKPCCCCICCILIVVIVIIGYFYLNQIGIVPKLPMGR